MKIPQHVAVILDGNGRWAKERKMPRTYGHKQGAKTLEDMCEIVYNEGIKYFTVYAFSTENWARPPKEVVAIMTLLRNYMKTSIKRANDNNMRVRVIGDLDKLDDDLKESILKLEDATKDNTGLNFQIALNYGSRDEMIRAMKKMFIEMKENNEDADAITMERFSSFLDTKDIPNPDLLIRTSGEERISNFLLWQIAYSELYFTDVNWPDFNREELLKAIESYNLRDRRYGKIKEEE
ncbi:undecaprenyl diphosphate synthase [Acetitomaculum ruminis DSM 5522]|uniref:Isoprenyl transferase n=1 Tax=Acetitomaculum ruminis DSM 5522 TaxID=1120918 RepID=A0A1I1A7E8_9FIRM|nr:isoprenyl transferase [Acetitomaculum ruminis]SFB33847.1 undecaprenyl diphosphate synthase [Acetitomaculum ruminis DSM 5522]